MIAWTRGALFSLFIAAGCSGANHPDGDASPALDGDAQVTLGGDANGDAGGVPMPVPFAQCGGRIFNTATGVIDPAEYARVATAWDRHRLHGKPSVGDVLEPPRRS